MLDFVALMSLLSYLLGFDLGAGPFLSALFFLYTIKKLVKFSCGEHNNSAVFRDTKTSLKSKLEKRVDYVQNGLSLFVTYIFPEPGRPKAN